MESVSSIAILTGVTAASFALALLLNWAALQTLFRVLPRPHRFRVLPTPPGEAHLEPGPLVPVRHPAPRLGRTGAAAVGRT